MALASVNPADGRLIKEYEPMSENEIGETIGEVSGAFDSWRRSSFADRSRVVRRLGEMVRERKAELGLLMTREMGKLLSAAEAEAEKCAWVCDYYAENAERFLEAEPVETDASSSFVTYQPIGAVLAVMPWNFPLWQVFRFLAPALMAGNVALLKHASNVQGCALAIEDLVRDAGAPDGVFRVLRIGSAEVDRVIADPRVAAVTLTGSTAAGRAVGAAAGRAIKRSVLELGGSDAYVVLEDADLDLAAATCVKSRMINSGQSCIAAKRFIVVDAVRSAFTSRVLGIMSEMRVGDPQDPSTELGPLARTDLRDELHDQVERAVAGGAELLLGGRMPDGAGAWYPPTLLADVRAGNPAYDEELFGPVASILPARDEAAAIEIANDSVFGLGAAVFTGDVDRGTRIAANELQAGHCAVNSFVKSDPRLPFGGVKESGYGRELSWFGIREFTNIKTVFVA